MALLELEGTMITLLTFTADLSFSHQIQNVEVRLKLESAGKYLSSLQVILTWSVVFRSAQDVRCLVNSSLL